MYTLHKDMNILSEKEVTVKGIDCKVVVIKYANSQISRRSYSLATGELVDVRFPRKRKTKKIYNSVVLPKGLVNFGKSIKE